MKPTSVYPNFFDILRERFTTKEDREQARARLSFPNGKYSYQPSRTYQEMRAKLKEAEDKIKQRQIK